MGRPIPAAARRDWTGHPPLSRPRAPRHMCSKGQRVKGPGPESSSRAIARGGGGSSSPYLDLALQSKPSCLPKHVVDARTSERNNKITNGSALRCFARVLVSVVKPSTEKNKKETSNRPTHRKTKGKNNIYFFNSNFFRLISTRIPKCVSWLAENI